MGEGKKDVCWGALGEWSHAGVLGDQRRRLAVALLENGMQVGCVESKCCFACCRVACRHHHSRTSRWRNAKGRVAVRLGLDTTQSETLIRALVLALMSTMDFCLVLVHPRLKCKRHHLTTKEGGSLSHIRTSAKKQEPARQCPRGPVSACQVQWKERDVPGGKQVHQQLLHGCSDVSWSPRDKGTQDKREAHRCSHHQEHLARDTPHSVLTTPSTRPHFGLMPLPL